MSDDRTAVFEAERSRLTGLGYRLLGSQAEAEDVVQDAWLRWERVAAPINTRAACPPPVPSRLALDRLRSARAQRESYPGPWLPEPLSAEPGPADHAELAD